MTPIFFSLYFFLKNPHIFCADFFGLLGQRIKYSPALDLSIPAEAIKRLFFIVLNIQIRLIVKIQKLIEDGEEIMYENLFRFILK